MEFLAGVDEDSRADDLRWAFRLRSLTRLDHPIDVGRLRALLRKDQQRPFDNQGKLTEKASEIVHELLVTENPDLERLIRLLLGIRDLDLPTIQKTALAEEKDAVASMLAFTGDPDLRPTGGFLTEEEINSIADRQSFFPAIPGIPPREDPMIEHDANTFLGWAPQKNDKLAVRRFSDNSGRTLEIMNVNRWPIETRLGTDLIYFHQQRQSFVLVQYKRLVPGGSFPRCRIDEHFRRQLEVMREIDKRCMSSGPGADYRMVPTPSFVKICKLDSLDVDSTSMISGMYMPREQLDRYLQRPDSPSYLAPETFRDYLTSTMFAQLVALGAVGTSGSATALVAKEIELSLQQGKTVSVGVFSDESGRRPSWRTKSSIPKRRRAQNSQQAQLWE